MKIVVLGLSLSSSWGNGHATTWRALLPGLARLGCDVLFLEREQPWYAAHRDLPSADYCTLAFYSSLSDLSRFDPDIRNADAVIVSSFVPEGIAVGDYVRRAARGLCVFYDIDTPVTLDAISRGECSYIGRDQFAMYDGFLSFTGGPLLALLQTKYRARRPRPLYCSVDTEHYKPHPCPKRWDLGFMGTYSADRQNALQALLIEPARRLPDRRFVVVGAQYPADIAWPQNVERFDHLSPAQHPEFYASLRWSLNLTRAAMVEAGFSPSVRLFESAACGTPIISDPWPGLDTALTPPDEIVVAHGASDVLAALSMSETHRRAIGAKARARTLKDHSGHKRAQQLLDWLHEFAADMHDPPHANPGIRPPLAEELTSS